MYDFEIIVPLAAKVGLTQAEIEIFVEISKLALSATATKLTLLSKFKELPKKFSRVIAPTMLALLLLDVMS